MIKEYLIGVDVGTQGTRAGLYETDGKLVGTYLCPTSLIYRGDAVEQDPDELYGSVLKAIHGVLEKAEMDARKNVLAVCIDGQMAGIIGVDSEGKASTSYDSWLDNRCEPYIKRMCSEEKLITSLTGGCVTNHHGPKILWWKEKQPEIWKGTYAFVTLSAYLSMRLCGSKEACMDDTHLHFTGFADNVQRKWDEELTHIFGDVSEKLPVIRHCTEIIGYVSRESAERVGLTAGTPVAVGLGDTAASALGAGVIKPGMALDVAGTASVLAISTECFKPDTEHYTLLYMRSVLPGLYTPLAYIGGGGLCIRWISRLLEKSYSELEILAKAVPTGSNGVKFLPHFSGRVCPSSPQMTGVWYGLKWSHGAGEMYRSVLESIAMEYCNYHNILLQSAAIEKGGIVIGTGGGAESRLFCQLKADALQMEYCPQAHLDTALWGSALVAGMAIGVYGKDGTGIPISSEERGSCHPHSDQWELWRNMTRDQQQLMELIGKCALSV